MEGEALEEAGCCGEGVDGEEDAEGDLKAEMEGEVWPGGDQEVR